MCVAYTAKCIGEWAVVKDSTYCFSAAFNRVNHQGILYKLCSVGIGGSVLSILTQFYQIDHSKLWWTVVRVNWLTSC